MSNFLILLFVFFLLNKHFSQSDNHKKHERNKVLFNFSYISVFLLFKLYKSGGYFHCVIKTVNNNAYSKLLPVSVLDTNESCVQNPSNNNHPHSRCQPIQKVIFILKFYPKQPICMSKSISELIIFLTRNYFSQSLNKK